jgi:hypothetical protein
MRAERGQHRYVGDPSQVQQHAVHAAAAEQGHVGVRHERRALPACRTVSAPEVCDDRAIQQRRQERPINVLQGARGLVEQRLPVHAAGGHVAGEVQPRLARCSRDGSRVCRGDVIAQASEFGESHGRSRAAAREDAGFQVIAVRRGGVVQQAEAGLGGSITCRVCPRQALLP